MESLESCTVANRPFIKVTFPYLRAVCFHYPHYGSITIPSNGKLDKIPEDTKKCYFELDKLTPISSHLKPLEVEVSNSFLGGSRYNKS